MKMKPEHYRYLKEKIDAMPNKEIVYKYYREHGLNDERYRWDLLLSCNLIAWIHDNLYGYLNDSHIDTALRRILKELL